MIIKSLECKNFRNYSDIHIDFDKKINFLYGDNGQGKTNIIEAVYICGTSKSHKGCKEKELIKFGQDESHIRLKVEKNNVLHKIDIHFKKNNVKGVAIDAVPIKKASDLIGLLNVVIFSPDDLSIVKDGPSERRKYLDREISQIKGVYLDNLIHYNKTLMQRNSLLKKAALRKDLKDTLDIWDEQLIKYGQEVIKKRDEFIKNIDILIKPLHGKITGKEENIELKYEPDVKIDDFEKILKESRERDLLIQQTLRGPHKDDFKIYSNGINLRTFGSQGQQRSAAISLKFAEIDYLKKNTGDLPVLLLDDVLSELDSERQKHVLSGIDDLQVIMTGTGIDDIIKNNSSINKIFYVKKGNITYK